MNLPGFSQDPSPPRQSKPPLEPKDIQKPGDETEPQPDQASVQPNQNYRVKKLSDQRYCDNEKTAGLCDVFTPDAKPTQRGWPVVMLVHGGGWASGDKWTMHRHARELTQTGFACIAINYRHAPQHTFPAQVDDVRQALVWIHDQASDLSLDLDRLGLYGYSAGGHLVSLVGTLADEKWQAVERTTDWEQDDPRWKKMPRIKAVCAGGPPVDFGYLPPKSIALAYFLGGTKSEIPEVYHAASPLQHVSKADPVFQIVHGEKDTLVSPSGSRDLSAALQQAGVKASLKLIPKAGHLLAFINPQLSKSLLGFFRQELQGSFQSVFEFDQSKD